MLTARARVALALTLAFAVWLAMLIWGGRGASGDVELFHLLYSGGNETLTRHAKFFSWLGGGRVIIPIGVTAAAYLVLHRKRRAALFLFIIFGGRFLVELQKVIIDRPRPGISPALVATNSYAFPSSHATNAMITFLAIGLLLPVRQRNRAIIVGIGIALALQVGVSRVMLGVHYPSDVVAGWTFGLAWIVICMRLASPRPDAQLEQSTS